MQQVTNVITTDGHETSAINLLRQKRQLYYNSVMLILNNIHTNCRDHLSRYKTLPSKNLFRDLKNLESCFHAKAKQRSLVILRKDLNLYYNHSITTCVITLSTMISRIKVPIQHCSADWKSFKYILIPLGWENHTCAISMEPTIVATNGASIIT